MVGVFSGRSRIFQTVGGALTRGGGANLLCNKNFDQNCMKILEIELKEGRISNAPLDPPITPLGGHLP